MAFPRGGLFIHCFQIKLVFRTLLYATLLYVTLCYGTLRYCIFTVLYSTLHYPTLLYALHYVTLLYFSVPFFLVERSDMSLRSYPFLQWRQSLLCLRNPEMELHPWKYHAIYESWRVHCDFRHLLFKAKEMSQVFLFTEFILWTDRKMLR